MNRLKWSFVVVVVLLVALAGMAFATAVVPISDMMGLGKYRATAVAGPMPLKVTIRCDEGGIQELGLVMITSRGRAIFECTANDGGGFTP